MFIVYDERSILGAIEDATVLTTESTLDDARKYLRVHKATLYRWARAKKIPAFKAGRSWRFKKEKIDAWLENQQGIR